jgi:ABC-type dipeptide/oligopeptide/nickel transport system permease subunit
MSSQYVQLFIAYAASAGGMLLVLLATRAEQRAYWRWPVYSVMAMVLGVVSWNLMRKHVLPPAWSLLHAGAMYAAALAVYALFGVGLGLLITRLARSRPTEFADIPKSPEDGGDRGRDS